MEIQLKRTVRAGNSSAVILPKAWLNQEVRVELIKKTPEIILLNIIEIVKKYINLSSIIGIYLTGSYARDEEDENSDIDILVVTNNIDKELINEGIYNILIVSSDLLKQKLSQDLFPLGQMIKEAKPILNSNYLDSIEVKPTKKNLKWYIDTTEDKLKLIRKVMDKIADDKKYIGDKVAYTLILRIRTMYIIKKLIKSENYSKKEFIQIINKISKGTNAYRGYLNIKNNKEDSKEASLDEIERLYEYLKEELLEVKELIGKI